jgi:hypothetical protein
MRSTWHPSTRSLDRYAKGHFKYEVWMSVQLGFLATRWPLGSKQAEVALRNSALEALIMHLRLLDDFFGHAGQVAPRRPNDRDNVFARHWAPAWNPRGFLTNVERSRANAQIAHLTARRRMQHQWRPPHMVARCCRLANEFFDEVQTDNPRRARAFQEARVLTDAFLSHQRALAAGLVVP